MDDLRFIGSGTSKKEAKRQASEGMLKLLGLEVSPPRTKEVTKIPESVSKTIKYLFSESAMKKSFSNLSLSRDHTSLTLRN